MIGLGFQIGGVASVLSLQRLVQLIEHTLANTPSDSALPGSAVVGFMAAAQAMVDLINLQG